jgi:hypothetical protein
LSRSTEVTTLGFLDAERFLTRDLLHSHGRELNHTVVSDIS